MKVLRTPDSRFANLADYPFAPHYTTITTADGSKLRIHHIDEGPAEGPVALCMHGQPVWSYLYRKVVPYLTSAGLRVIAPDLVGYGKSDKPAEREDYSYERQVEWMGAWLEANDFRGITFFGQDWGGLIGLRMIAAAPDRFARVVISNTGLPYNPDVPDSVVEEIENFRMHAPTPSMTEMQNNIRTMDSKVHSAKRFAYWQKWCWETEDLPIGFMMSMMLDRPSKPLQLLKFLLYNLGIVSPLPSALATAYDAPFPDASYKMGPRAMPSQVPTLPTSPSLEAQREAWEFFKTFDKPFLCAFADSDPVTRAMEPVFKKRVPGAQGQNHRKIAKGGHFVQENAPEQVARAIIDLIESESL